MAEPENEMLTKFNQAVGALITGGIVVVVVVGGIAILNGFVLSTLWGWFVVATFSDVPSLSLTAAIGIGLMIRWLTGGITLKVRWLTGGITLKVQVDENKKKQWKPLFGMYLAPIVVLGTGWIVNYFM